MSQYYFSFCLTSNEETHGYFQGDKFAIILRVLCLILGLSGVVSFTIYAFKLPRKETDKSEYIKVLTIYVLEILREWVFF